jgi:NAD(P)H-dependent flavin oxidoreductase YrpB (nitropropane dioxygenase family)
MKTKVTKLLGIEHPVVQAAMAYVSTPQLVAAVSSAGGLGMMSSALTTRDELKKDIAAVKELTDKPFGISLIPFSPGIKELAQIVMEEKVPVVASSFGSPKEIFDLFKNYDCIRMAVVGSLRHAIRAEKDGADIIVSEGIEAAGHVSQAGSMVLVPKVAESVKVPVVASGGYSTGKQLAAALTLGAEGMYMGTRFILTEESPFPANIKERYVHTRTAEETIVTMRLDSYPFRIINNKLAQRIVKRRVNYLWQTLPIIVEMRRTYNASLGELITTALKIKRAYSANAAGMIVITKLIQQATTGGDPEELLLACGQGIQLIDNIPTCKGLIEQIVREAEETLKNTADRVVS